MQNKLISILYLQLKPYVSYRVPEVHQTMMTARDLFHATYAADITKEILEGKAVFKDKEIVRLHADKQDKKG